MRRRFTSFCERMIVVESDLYLDVSGKACKRIAAPERDVVFTHVETNCLGFGLYYRGSTEIAP